MNTSRSGRPLRPTPQQTLLLKAAVLQGEHVESSWQAWKDNGGTIEEVDSASQRILPQLYANLRDHGVGDRDLGRLRGIYRRAWFDNQRLHFQTAKFLAHLQQRSVDFLVLKGAGITAAYPRSIAIRPMNDVDVLVQPQGVRATIDALHEHGWRITAASGVKGTLEQIQRVRHSIGWTNGTGGELDLHWAPLREPGDNIDLFPLAISGKIGPLATKAPCSADQFFISCIHGVSWYPAPLRWIADCAFLLAVDPPSWELVLQRGQDFRAASILRPTLSYLRDGLGLDIPDHVIRTLQNTPASRSDRFMADIQLYGPARTTALFSYIEQWRRFQHATYPTGSPTGVLDYLRTLYGAASTSLLVAFFLRSGWSKLLLTARRLGRAQ